MGNPLKKIQPWIDPIGNQITKGLGWQNGIGAGNHLPPGAPSYTHPNIGGYTPPPADPYASGALKAAPAGGPASNPSATGNNGSYKPPVQSYTPNFFEASNAQPSSATIGASVLPRMPIQNPNIMPQGGAPAGMPPGGMPPGGAPPPGAGMPPQVGGSPQAPVMSGAPPPQAQPMPQAPMNSATQGRFNPALIAALRGGVG